MNREFKKSFFTSLLTVLLIISSLIGLKLTNFFNLTISVDFLTYPFTFLCTLLIYNYSNKKKAYESILIATLIQIFIIISYTLAIKLGDQAVIPDMASYVNALFKVDEIKILSRLLAFLLSHYTLIYIYENFKNYGKEFLGVILGLLASLFLDATIYLVITLNDYEPTFVINMLLSNIIVSIIMVVIITGLYYLLKENSQEVVVIEGMNISVSNLKDKDKSIEDVMKKTDTSKKNNYKKPRKNNNYNKTSDKNNNKTNSKNTTKKTTIKTKNSKVKVKQPEKK